MVIKFIGFENVRKVEQIYGILETLSGMHSDRSSVSLPTTHTSCA